MSERTFHLRNKTLNLSSSKQMFDRLKRDSQWESLLFPTGGMASSLFSITFSYLLLLLCKNCIAFFLTDLLLRYWISIKSLAGDVDVYDLVAVVNRQRINLLLPLGRYFWSNNSGCFFMLFSVKPCSLYELVRWEEGLGLILKHITENSIKGYFDLFNTFSNGSYGDSFYLNVCIAT